MRLLVIEKSLEQDQKDCRKLCACHPASTWSLDSDTLLPKACIELLRVLQ